MFEYIDILVYGWIVGGSYVYGLFFVWGGVVVVLISVGIVVMGVIMVGVVGFGIISIGIIVIGLFVFGVLVVGYKVYVFLFVIGWESVFSGGFLLVKEVVVGFVVVVCYVNDE